jgi:hypothetical protein
MIGRHGWYYAVVTETAFLATGILLCSAVPVILIWGWVKWTRKPGIERGMGAFSRLGFLLGSASALLAIGAILRGGWAFYDPLLMKIYLAGMLISSVALVCGLLGAVRPGPLRWHAPALSFGMLALWVLWASLE